MPVRTEASVKNKSLRASLEVLHEHVHAVLVQALPRLAELLAFVANHRHKAHQHGSGESQALVVALLQELHVHRVRRRAPI